MLHDLDRRYHTALVHQPTFDPAWLWDVLDLHGHEGPPPTAPWLGRSMVETNAKLAMPTLRSPGPARHAMTDTRASKWKPGTPIGRVSRCVASEDLIVLEAWNRSSWHVSPLPSLCTAELTMVESIAKIRQRPSPSSSGCCRSPDPEAMSRARWLS